MLALEKYIKPGQKVLEIGCGNGVTAIHLAKNCKLKITASDYSQEMIKEAKKLAQDQKLKGSVEFKCLDVTFLKKSKARYDLIYTERVIINLLTWKEQKKAIQNICGLLKRGGFFLMLENSADGLKKINAFRKCIGLNAIQAPWHNRYLNDQEIQSLKIKGIKLDNIDYYSSVYYFLSRIVNAFLAKHKNNKPDYNSKINRLALSLPSIS